LGRRPELVLIFCLFFAFGSANARNKMQKKLRKHYESIPLTWFRVGISRPVAKARRLLDAGRATQAMEAVRRAAYREPHARLLYGYIALQNHRYKEAKWALCPRVKAMRPAGPWRDFWCGESLMLLGDVRGALRRFNRVAGVPGGPGRRLALYRARAMLRLRRNKDACKTVRESYKTLPANDFSVPIAKACKMKTAVPAVKSAESQTREAMTAFLNAKYSKAMELLLTLDATDCEVRNIIARTNMRLRKYSTARDLFIALADDAKCGKELRGDWLLYRAARSALRAGDTTGATRITERMINTFPKTTLSDDMLVTLARVALFHGDFRTAIDTAARSRKAFPKGDFRWYALWVEFLANYTRKDYKAAISCLEQAKTCEDPYLLPRFRYWKYRAMERIDKKKAIKGLWTVLDARPLNFYGILAANRLSRLLRLPLRKVYQKLKNTNPPLPRFVQVPDRRTRLYGRPAMIKFLLASGMENTARAELHAMSRGKDWEKWVAVLGFRALKDLARSTGLAWKLLQAHPFFPKTWTGQKFYRLAYPTPFAWIIRHYSRIMGISRWLVYGIMRRESVFNPDAVSWAGAVGLMQLMPATARRVALKLRYSRRTARRWSRRDHLKMPKINVKLGTWYLNYLMRLFKNPMFAAAGYNGGEGAVFKLKKKYPRRAADELTELIEARETRRYVRAVVEGYARYRFLYKKGSKRYLRLNF